MNNIMQMHVLETAAHTWFAEMSPKEREAYVKAHPRSKYAKNSQWYLTDHSNQLWRKSGYLSERHLFKKGKLAPMHHALSELHEKAQWHYGQAEGHFENGDNDRGQAALDRGHIITKSALAFHDKLKKQQAILKAGGKITPYDPEGPDSYRPFPENVRNAIQKGTKSPGKPIRVKR